MAGSSKRRSRQSPPAKTRSKPVDNEWEKEDEELELEAQLFGRSKKRAKPDPGPSSLQNGDLVDDDDVASQDEFDDLFEVDAPLAGELHLDSEQDGEVDEDDEERPEQDEQQEEEDSDEDEDDDESDSGSESDASSGPEYNGADAQEGGMSNYIETGPNAPRIDVPAGVYDLEDQEEQERKSGDKGKGKAVWHDPADDLVSVDLEKDNRLKKLARGKKGSTVNGLELMKRLRKQYETLHPRPDWADKRTTAGTPSLSALLSSTKSFIDNPSSSSIIKGQKKRTAALKSGTIDMQRLRNANHQNPTTGKQEASNAGSGVVDLAWHPSERVGVLAVAGGDRRIRFFNIDGHTNPSLMTLHIPSLPLSKSTFHPSGSSILFTGTRPFYYTYDLPSQRCLRSPRNLFGSVPDPTSPNSLTTHRFSPDGSLLAVAGRRGAVSVLDWSQVGVGAVVADLRSGRGGAVAALEWSRDGKELSVLGGRDGAEVEVWDVGQRKVVRKWRDDRAYGGTVLESSRGGEYTAIGSTTGIVNVYSSTSLSAKSLDLRPDPLKSLEHLTTPITSLAFHPSSELLVTASRAKRDQLKLYHLPTLTAYQNFPAMNAPYKRVSSLGFSANGEYLASGNQQGAVLLYRVKHYRST